jgi:hypothetical protein
VFSSRGRPSDKRVTGSATERSANRTPVSRSSSTGRVEGTRSGAALSTISTPIVPIGGDIASRGVVGGVSGAGVGVASSRGGAIGAVSNVSDCGVTGVDVGSRSSGCSALDETVASASVKALGVRRVGDRRRAT